VKSVLFAPVYNQVEELPRFLAEAHASGMASDELLLVNNGCTDGSAALIRESGYEVLEIPVNRGVGYGYMHALEWALGRGYDIFGTIAGNGKMLPQERSRMLEPIIAGRVDYVRGSRFLPGGIAPYLTAFRRRAIPLVNSFVRVVTGARLTDATCGYRAYRLDIMRRATFDWHAPWLYTYGLEYYVDAKVLLDGRLRWLEVPVTMRYPANRRRVSKIRPGRDWWAMLRPWLVARFDGRGFRHEP
jgi:glycosyltransferase involved in cell wall biosynthesis